MASVTGCDEDNVCASVNTSKIEVPPPTPTPTPTPTPVLSVTATISVTDDDVKITYGWKPGGSSQSSETWAITLRQSTARNGTYTNYSSASSPAAGTARFDNVPRNRWYMARVSGCDEHSNCASANTGKLKVETPTPVPTTPPPPTPTPSGKLTATPTIIERFATTNVTATDLSPSSLYFRIEYPDTLQLGTNCSTRGTGKRYTTKFTTTTNFTFRGCKYGVHTLKLLTETGTTALATVSITVATPTPTPVPAGPSFATTTAIHHAYHKDVRVNMQLPAASGGVAPLEYTITPSMKNSLSFSTTTRTVSGTPGEAATTGTYTYKVTDAKGRTAQREFKVTVFDLSLKVNWRLEGYLDPKYILWWQVTDYRYARFDNSPVTGTIDDILFQVRTYANSEFQLGSKDCNWKLVSSAPTQSFRSKWLRQGQRFPIVRCGIGAGSLLRLQVWAKADSGGTERSLYDTKMEVPPAHHDRDGLLTYHVRGTYVDSDNKVRIRAIDSSEGDGMFEPLPSTFVDPRKNTGKPLLNPGMFDVRLYSDAATVWNGIATNTIIAATSSPIAERIIRGFWAHDSYTAKKKLGSCLGSDVIACVDWRDFKTMWIQVPPSLPNAASSGDWATTYDDWVVNKAVTLYLPPILLHEFGHFLGLGHNEVEGSIMFNAHKDEICFEQLNTCLSEVDRNALNAIYGQAAAGRYYK